MGQFIDGGVSQSLCVCVCAGGGGGREWRCLLKEVEYLFSC